MITRSGLCAIRLDACRQQPGRTGSDDYIFRACRIQLCVQPAFEVFGFRGVLLNKIDAGAKLAQIPGECQVILHARGLQSELCQRGFCVVDFLPQQPLRIRGGIGGDDMQSTRQTPGGPAGADDPGSDDTDGFLYL